MNDISILIYLCAREQELMLKFAHSELPLQKAKCLTAELNLLILTLELSYLVSQIYEDVIKKNNASILKHKMIDVLSFMERPKAIISHFLLFNQIW